MSRQAQTKTAHGHQASIAEGTQRNNIHREWSQGLNHKTIGKKNCMEQLNEESKRESFKPNAVNHQTPDINWGKIYMNRGETKE